MPSTSLHGLLPQSLLHSYRFWRSGPDTIVGYLTNTPETDPTTAPSKKGPGDDREDHMWLATTIYIDLLHLDTECGKQHSAMVYRLPMKPSPDALVLLNIVDAPKESVLFHIYQIFSKLDSASHILVWGECEEGVPRDGEVVHVHLVELPRYGLSFKRSEDGRLECMNLSGKFVAWKCPDRAAEHVRRCQNCIVLEDNSGCLSLLVANHPLKRTEVTECPHLMQCDPVEHAYSENSKSDSWAKCVKTKYYVIDIHFSGAFLVFPSLESQLYLVYVRCKTCDYEDAVRLLVCGSFTDMKLSAEQAYQALNILTIKDKDPDILGVCLRVVLIYLASGTNLPSLRPSPKAIYLAYLARMQDASAATRLTRTDELELLQYLDEPELLHRMRYLTEGDSKPQKIING